MLFIIVDMIGAITFFKFEIVIRPMNVNRFFLNLHTVIKEGNMRCCCYALGTAIFKGFQLLKVMRIELLKWINALMIRK